MKTPRIAGEFLYMVCWPYVNKKFPNEKNAASQGSACSSDRYDDVADRKGPRAFQANRQRNRSEGQTGNGSDHCIHASDASTPGRVTKIDAAIVA